MEEVEMEEKKNIKALLSFIFGIVGCVLAFCCGGGFPFGVAALVLGILAKKDDPENKQAKIGFILGIVSLVICVVAGIITTASGVLSTVLQNANF